MYSLFRLLALPVLGFGVALAAVAAPATVQLPATQSIVPQAAPPPGCNFDQIEGREFVFNSADANLRRFGYILWKQRPSLVAEPLSYEEYQGRHGKLTGRIVGGDGVNWYEGVMDDCSEVYAEDASANSRFPGLQHLELNGKVHFLDMLAAGEALIGNRVVVRGEGLEPRQRLYTRKRGVWYPLRDDQELEVEGIDTHRYAHAKGVGPFFLRVRDENNRSGLIKFNPTYLKLKAGPLPMIAHAQRPPPNVVPASMPDLLAPAAETVPPAGAFVLNVASMEIEANAEAAASQLQQAGFPARIRPHTLDDSHRRLYRVQITGFPDIPSALEIGKELARRYGWQDTWVLPQ